MKSKKKSSVPVSDPQQTRSKRTQSAILEVVQRHLAEGSFDTVSVNDLVHEAGCSVGAFYGRFSNKAAALYGFYERNCEELERRAAEILSPERKADLGALLGEFTDLVVHRTFTHAGILRAEAFRREIESGGAFAERAQQLNARLLEIIQRCLHARHDEITAPAEPDTALFVLALIGGMSRDAVVHGPRFVQKSGNFDEHKFANELSRAVTGYLGARG